MEPRIERDENGRHSPEPWKQQGRYIRDAAGEIVVRGRSVADARRIVAAVNATRGIPTDALERWFALDVSDAKTRPNLEIEVGDPSSPQRVRPPAPVSRHRAAGEGAALEKLPESPLIFDRRIFERRISARRTTTDRRMADRRRGPAGAISEPET